MPASTSPTFTLREFVSGYSVIVQFPTGYFAGRQPVIGPIRPTIEAAVSAALARTAPVLADVLTPKVYPDVDD